MYVISLLVLLRLQMEDDEMGGARISHEGAERCIQEFIRNPRRTLGRPKQR